MEDNLSQDSHQYDHLSSATPKANPVILVPRTVDDDLHNISLNEHDDYLSNNLSHIHLLHQTVSTDPTLNHHNTTIADNNHFSHGQVLQYFTDSSHDRLKSTEPQSIIPPSTTNTFAEVNLDPNNDITFLYDLVTPPSNVPTRLSVQTRSHPTDSNYFDHHWHT